MSTFSVAIRGKTISTTVAKKNKDVDDSITKFLSNCRNFIIGIDTELSLSRDSEGVTRSKIAILTLCDGDHCLIVQLPLLDSVPISLCNFLQLPDHTFVGLKIARSMERLEKEYGLGCKHYFDVKTAFSGDSVRPSMYSMGGPRKLDSAVFDDWGGYYLNENQITRTTFNCWFYREIVPFGYF